MKALAQPVYPRIVDVFDELTAANERGLRQT